MTLSFPIKFRTWVNADTSMSFSGEDGGKEVTCRVSGDALTECLGAIAAKAEPAYRAFDCHRARLEEIATKKFEAGQTEKDGTILIGPNDL